MIGSDLVSTLFCPCIFFLQGKSSAVDKIVGRASETTFNLNELFWLRIFVIIGYVRTSLRD